VPTLREIREDKYLSVGELAEKAGVAKTTVIDIERGRRQPIKRTARRLAEALGMSPHAIDWPAAPEGRDAGAATHER
jgi:transcriptional regulator with XRE-family HTH domain